jgi:hypothetical protein
MPKIDVTQEENFAQNECKNYTLKRKPVKPFRIPVPRLSSIISPGKDSCGVW